MHRISFIALTDTYHSNQIGGTDSYMRRLSSCLHKLGYETEWNFYGGTENRKESVGNVSIQHHVTFDDAIAYLRASTPDELVVCFIKPTDRLKLARFRLTPKKRRPRISSLSFFYPDTLSKKLLRAIEITLVPYHALLCVSERIYNFNKSISRKSYYLPPIVPDAYFAVGREKADRPGPKKSLNILFLGRLDPRKGIFEVIELIGRLSGQNGIRWTVSGIHIPEDPGNKESLAELKSLKNVTLHEEERSQYSAAVEARVTRFFSENDVFVQPYKSLSSTVDLPLLLLEAQAAGCRVLTTLPQILSPYLVGSSTAFSHDYVSYAESVILSHFKQQNSLTASDISQLHDKYSEAAADERIRKLFDQP